MKSEIRTANEIDFEVIYLLIKEFGDFINKSEKITITLEQMINNKMFFGCFVAEVDSKIVGFATFFDAYYSWTGRAIYLDDLYVLETYRGHGIGTKLFNTIIGKAKEEKCYKVKWQVSNWNTKAIEFYKKMGAIIDDVEINCDLKLEYNNH